MDKWDRADLPTSSQTARKIAIYSATRAREFQPPAKKEEQVQTSTTLFQYGNGSPH